MHSSSSHCAVEPLTCLLVSIALITWLFFFCKRYIHKRASPVTLAVKSTSDNAADVDSVPELGRSPGGGHGNPF